MIARRRPTASRTTLAGIVGALVIAVAGVLALLDERAVSAAEQALTLTAARATTTLPDPAPSTLDRLPRVLLAEGQRYALASGQANAAERPRLLDQAEQRLRRAASARPDWGEALIAVAVVTVQRHGARSPDAAAALERSYRALPFSRGGGAWRVGIGLELWPTANEALRKHIIDEAVWTAAASPAAIDAIAEAMRGSPAYGPFMLRWHQFRMSDLKS